MTNVTPLRQMTLAEARAKAEAINYDPDWTVEQLMAATAHMTQAEKAELGQALRIVATATQEEAAALDAEGRVKILAQRLASAADPQQVADARALLAEIGHDRSWSMGDFIAAISNLSEDRKSALCEAMAVSALAAAGTQLFGA